MPPYLFLRSRNSRFLDASSVNCCGLPRVAPDVAMTIPCGNVVGVVIWYACTLPAAMLDTIV